MNIKKELRKPSNIISIGLILFTAIYGNVAVGSAYVLFEVAVWIALGYAITTVVTPWLMNGFGLKDPADEQVDQ